MAERLTTAQREALEVLAEAVEPVGAWKKRTRREPYPLVNMIAASSLERMGLARTELPDRRLWSPFTCDYKYEITDAGRETLDG